MGRVSASNSHSQPQGEVLLGEVWSFNVLQAGLFFKTKEKKRLIVLLSLGIAVRTTHDSLLEGKSWARRLPAAAALCRRRASRLACQGSHLLLSITMCCSLYATGCGQLG